MKSYKNVLKSFDRPKIGVVLAGGGLRCFASIELFQFLEDAEIPIDLLIGCSGGGLCAGLRALQLPVIEMKKIISTCLDPKLFAKINYKTMFGILGCPFVQYNEFSSVMDPQLYMTSLKNITHGIRIEDLKIKTLLQVTELQTGQGIIIDSGDLATALYATSAFTPMLPPIKLNDKFFVDGGFSSNLPILEAINKNIDIIIAIDFKTKIKTKPINLINTYYNFIHRCLQTVTSLQNSMASNLHHYKIIFISVPFDTPISLRSVHSLPYIYTMGKETILSVQDNIIEAIEQFPYINKPNYFEDL